MKIFEEMRLRHGFGLQTRLHEIEYDLLEGRIPHSEALVRFNTEWPAVAKICEWCAEQGGGNLRASTLLSKLVGVAGNLASLALSVPEHIHWREKAYVAAKAAGLANDELGHGAQMAYLHFVSGNAKHALELLDELMDRNESLGESPGDAKLAGVAKVERSAAERKDVRATILSHRGMIFATSGREKEALPILEEAAVYFRKHNTEALARCLNTFAVVQGYLGKPEDALKTIDEALALPVHGSKATGLINRGGYLSSLGRICEALESLEAGHRLAQANGEHSTVALAAAQIGLWRIRHGDDGQRAEAVNWLEQSLALCNKTGDKRLRLHVLDTLEHVLITAVESDKATSEQKTEIWRKLSSVREQLGKAELEAEATRRYLESAPDDLEVQLEGNIRLGHALVMLKQHDQALSHHETALAALAALRRTSSDKRYEKAEAELLLGKGQALRGSGNPEQAAETYAQAIKVAEAFADHDALWRARGNLALAQVDCRRYEQAITALQDVVSHYGRTGAPGHTPDLRLLGHARFNLAYANYRSSNLTEARKEGTEALRILSLVDDRPGIEEVNRQMSQW